MRRVVTAITAVGLIVSVSASAFAQESNAVRVNDRSAEYTFGDQLVQTSLVRPDQATVRPRRHHEGPSLVRHRAHFVPEMLRDVERL